jgi:hypothetical protein
MRIRLVALSVAASAMLFAGSVRAQELQRETVRTRHPGAAAMAAIGNVVFAPVRFALTIVNAGVGGATGKLTAGDRQAASDVFGLTSGQGFLQPEMLTGTETLYVGETGYNLKVTEP